MITVPWLERTICQESANYGIRETTIGDFSFAASVRVSVWIRDRLPTWIGTQEPLQGRETVIRTQARRLPSESVALSRNRNTIRAERHGGLED
jgi:hypothetical protein